MIVSARPAALRRFAAQGGSRTRGMRDAATHVQATAGRLNSSPADPEFAVRVPDLSGAISALTARWTQLDDYAARIAAGFERADQLGGLSPIALADAAAVDRAADFPADFNPLDSLVAGSPAAWRRAVYGNRTLPRGVKLLGGGFLRLPDGRLVPLVIPVVRGRDGHWYSADDGPGGDIGSLDGRDPGWVAVGGTRGTGKLFDRDGAGWAAALIALTGGAVPITSAPAGDYAGLRHGGGRPRWISGGRPVSAWKGWVAPVPHDARHHRPVRYGPGAPVTATPGGARATGVSIAVNALDGLNKVHASKIGAYDVVVERNADGRERARVQVTTITVGKQGERVLHPTHVYLDQEGRTVRSPVSYRGRPDPDVARATEGHRDDDPGYRVSEPGQ